MFTRPAALERRDKWFCRVCERFGHAYRDIDQCLILLREEVAAIQAVIKKQAQQQVYLADVERRQARIDEARERDRVRSARRRIAERNRVKLATPPVVTPDVQEDTWQTPKGIPEFE